MKKLRDKPQATAVPGFCGRLAYDRHRRLFDCTVRMMAACDPDERNSEEASKKNQRNAEAA
jgi:hypothetical protein